ncbi:MAG: HAMP domain-containing sensor histidine kinase, partial [Spirochaetota bacterium]
FTNALHTVEDLSKDLKELNQNLEYKVEERTLALKQQKESAEKANLLKDKFVSSVSHDLVSPISGVMNLLKITRNSHRTISSKELLENLNNSLQSLEIVSRFTREILKMDKLYFHQLQLNFDFISIRELVENSKKRHLPAIISKEITLKIDIDEDAFFVGDAELYSQVIANLLSNAIKYSYSRSTISIRCSYYNNIYKISIHDTGVGIPKKRQPILFQKNQRFYTQGTQGELGNGIGLSFSYDIVKTHGGEIKVKSSLDKGSIFTIEQPFMEYIIFFLRSEVQDDKNKVVKAENYIGYYFYQAEILLKTLENIKPNVLLVHIDAFYKNEKIVQSIQEKEGYRVYIYSQTTIPRLGSVNLQVVSGADETSILRSISQETISHL